MFKWAYFVIIISKEFELKENIFIIQTNVPFIGTKAIIWLAKSQWSNPESCKLIHHMNPLRADDVIIAHI